MHLCTNLYIQIFQGENENQKRKEKYILDNFEVLRKCHYKFHAIDFSDHFANQNTSFQETYELRKDEAKESTKNSSLQKKK